MGRTLNEDPRDPFEQLVRSHRRLEECLAALVAIASSESIDAGAVGEVFEFLTRQGRRHEDDEEQTLLPRLAHVPELEGVLATLSADVEHDRIGAASAGPGDIENPRRVERRPESLVGPYLDHLRGEGRINAAGRKRPEIGRGGLHLEAVG